MAYVVKKRCVLCHKVLDAEGRCINPDCIMSTVPTEESNTAGMESIKKELTDLAT